MSPIYPLGKIKRKRPFVVSLSNHEWPFDRLMKQLAIQLGHQEAVAKSLVIRANGFWVDGQFEARVS